MVEKPKILIVDDKITNLIALEKLLTNMDIELIRANSGNEALQKILEHEFALALVDAQMPEIDGYETVQLMRKAKKNRLLPVIFISTIHSDNTYIVKGLKSGAVDFITKPIVPEILKGKVRVFLDIWDHKQALQRSEANLSEAQRIAHLGSWDINMFTGEISWSDELYRIFAVSSEESDLRQVLSKRIHPDDRERYRKTVDKCIQEKTPYKVEYRIILDDGTVRHIYAQGVQTLDKEGKLIRFAGTAQDITERKQTEESLKKANMELKKLDRMKSDFLSTVSHEIRTPIAMMREGVSLCLDGVAGKITNVQSDLLTSTLENIDRLTRLVTDLLDISKIEAGRIILRRKSIDLCKMIQKLYTNYKNQAEANTIRFKIDIPEKPLMTYADEDKLTQVFNNLLSNAIRFTQAQGEITIRAEGKDKQFVCSVSDTGIGISEENIPKLFSKFEQIGRIDGPGYQGTGLGLPIVKGLVEKHGGEVWVESKLGRGSTFGVILPKDPFPDILIADDEKIYQDIIRKFLEGDDYIFTEACNGEEAIQKAFDENPSLIILDLMMPGINGYEVIGRLKQDHRTQSIPLIVISGFEVDGEKIELVTEQAAIPILTKPIDREILQTRVRELLVN